MKISAVILTKNEEHNIKRCIESCIDVCDEILVIDSGSIDKTKEIAREFDKVKVIETSWLGFSNTKNYGNNLATGDYILSLDADEALEPKLQTAILAIKPNLNGQAYRFPRLTNYCGEWIYHCGWRPDYQTRLFPKAKSRWNENLVHEKLILPSDSKLETINFDILHYSYNTISEHIKKIDVYSTLAAQMLVENTKSGFGLSIKAAFRAKFKFFRTYILQRGFLDGYYGFVISSLSAFVVFLKYTKLAQMIRDDKKGRKG